MLFRRAESGDAFRPLYFQQQRKKDIMIKLEHISKTFGDTGDGVHALRTSPLRSETARSSASSASPVRESHAGPLHQPFRAAHQRQHHRQRSEADVDGEAGGRHVLYAYRLPPRAAAGPEKISMIFQGFNLLMQRTCLKNVCFPMELSGVPKLRPRKRRWSCWIWWD